MGIATLFEQVHAAVQEHRYVIGFHAANRLDERGIPDWQIVAGLHQARVLRTRPSAKPFAVVEVEQILPEGTAVKAVWSWLPMQRVAKLVTVHYLDR